MHWIWVGNGRLTDLILYTTASELAKIGWKDERLTVVEEIDHLWTEKYEPNWMKAQHCKDLLFWTQQPN